MKKSIFSSLFIIGILFIQPAFAQVDTTFHLKPKPQFTETQVFELAKAYPHSRKALFSETGEIKSNLKSVMRMESREDLHRFFNQQEEFYKKIYEWDSFQDEIKHVKSIQQLIHLYEKYPVVLGGKNSEEFNTQIQLLENGTIIPFITQEGKLSILDTRQYDKAEIPKLKEEMIGCGNRPLTKH